MRGKEQYHGCKNIRSGGSNGCKCFYTARGRPLTRPAGGRGAARSRVYSQRGKPRRRRLELRAAGAGTRRGSTAQRRSALAAPRAPRPRAAPATPRPARRTPARRESRPPSRTSNRRLASRRPRPAPAAAARARTAAQPAARRGPRRGAPRPPRP
ncbi:MAG: hypothetical protein J3K34DRAFT_414833, partial [Monoraphidium minutum]